MRQILSVTLLVVTALTVSGAQSARFSDGDKKAIDQLLDRYYRAYTAKDYTLLREQLLQAPFIYVGPAPDRPLGARLTLDEVMNAYRTQRDGLDAQNYARSEHGRSQTTVF